MPLKATPRLNPSFGRSIKRVLPGAEGVDWQDWVDMAVGYNGRLGLPNLVEPDPDWRVFADRLALHVPDAPSHDEFDDWRDWAMALRSALAL